MASTFPNTTHQWLQPLYHWLKRGADTTYNVHGFGAVGDGTTDDTTAINAAIDFAETSGGEVFLPPGTYLISAALSVASSNVRIRGAGRGLTTIKMAATFIDSDASAISVYNSTYGTSQALSFDGNSGDQFVTVSATTGISAGDWVLVRSLKVADTESSTNKFCGELQKIQAVDATTGVLTFYGYLADTYTTAQSASVLKVTMLTGIGITGLTVTHAASAAPLISSPAILVRNCLGAVIDDVEVRDVFNTGIDTWSCVDSAVRKCSVSNVQAGSSQTVYYGVWVSGASRGVTIADCAFDRTRHSVAMGTHTNAGSNTLSTDAREGIQRNITVSRAHSSASTTAHYDVHQPADGVTFVDCKAIGAWPQGAPDSTQWKSAVYGFQSRAKRVAFIGCVVEQASGGVLLFGPALADNVISNCVIRDVKQAGVQTQLASAITSGAATVPLRDATGFTSSGTVTIAGSSVTYSGVSSNTLTGCSGAPTASAGQGVYQLVANTGNGIELDTTCTGTGVLIEGCEIIETTASGIKGQGNQSRVTVRNTTLKSNSTVSALGSIQFSSATDRIVIDGCRISDNPNSRPVAITGSGDWHQISNCQFEFNSTSAPSWVGPNSRVYNNRYYSPGTLTNGFPFQVLGTAWLPATVYVAGNIVSNNGNNYICQVGGTSAGSGGPSGNSTANIADNTVIWKWLYPGLVTPWLPGVTVGKGAMRSNAGRIFECQSSGITATGASGPVSNSLTALTTESGPTPPTWKYVYEGTECFANLGSSTGSTAPSLGYQHAVRSGPATLTLTGGTGLMLTINAALVATGTPFGPIKLGIGDVFIATYSSGFAPSSRMTFEG